MMVVFSPTDDQLQADSEMVEDARTGDHRRMEPKVPPPPPLERGLSAEMQSAVVGKWQYCVDCAEQKPCEAFTDRGATRCKGCLKAAAEDEGLRAAARAKMYNRTVREVKVLERCNNYKLLIAEYERILDHQGGVCAICGRRPRSDRPLHIDHDHKTGRVRGLLCVRCNTGLGHFQDNMDRLETAILYLDEPPAIHIGIVGFGKRDAP